MQASSTCFQFSLWQVGFNSQRNGTAARTDAPAAAIGLPVHRERVQSSTPMVSKVFAMCGMLMPPTSLTKDNWYYPGQAGPPCHLR
eukprot:3560192-Karenia_brevis.AAC.1